MTNNLTPTRRAARLSAALLAVLTVTGSSLLAQTAPTPQPAQKPLENDIVELSPFQVTADSEQGYMATSTLNGTRINTSLKDLGAPMTIFTEELLNDLGATNLNDVLNFAPNTDSYVGSQTDTVGNGNDFLNNAVQYVTRGGTTNLVGQNFFGSNIPPDRYNAESFTFTRGPNAILFGLGNPAGAFLSSTKRALFKDRNSIEYRTDNYGSIRGVLDINKVIIPNKLALRYSGLYENSESFREPSYGRQRRQFVTATLKPFKKTTIRFNFEDGEHFRLAIRPWPVYDGVTPWLQAGSPLDTTPGVFANAPGIQNVNANAYLVVTDYSPAGTPIDAFSWRNMSRSANSAFPGTPNIGGKASVTDSNIFPLDANVIGGGSSRKAEFTTGTLYWEQEILRDLHFEGVVHNAKDKTLVNNSFVGDFDRLYIDVNTKLPNGADNPNVGKPYVESFGTLLPSEGESTTKRASLSYSLDFSHRPGLWGKLLGRHQAVAFFESTDSDDWSLGNLRTHNTSPAALNTRLGLTGAAAFPTAITNLNNRVWNRYYLDPAAGAVSAGVDLTADYPLLFAGDPLPTPNASGVTPAFVQHSTGSTTNTRLITRAAALQSFFWNRRLVTTMGWRNDRQTLHRFSPSGADPVTGFQPNPLGFDAKRDNPGSRRDRDGDTFTRGVTFHAFSWLSLYYNQSNNFQPNDTARNIYGELLPNPEGEGKDYGIKFNFWDGKIVGDISYYKNFSNNRADNTVRTGIHGNLQGDINNVWATVADITGDVKYDSPPYATGFGQWADINTGYSDGYEFTVTANPTKNWRITVNGSKRGDGETIERGTFARQYLAEYIPEWKSHPEWLSAVSANDNTKTVAEIVGQIEQSLANFNALSVLPADSLLTAKWTLNLVTRYDFDDTPLLKGWAAGGNLRMRGQALVGFGEDSTGTFDPTLPYYTDEVKDIGFFVSYKRRIFKNINWRVQLNINNAFEEGGLKAQRIVDPRDGTGEGRGVIYRVLEPRSYVLTSSFTF